MWLALRFPHWSLDSLAPAAAHDTRAAADRHAMLVADSCDGRRVVVAVGESWADQTIQLGMPLADARLKAPSAVIQPRRIASEQAALQRLAGWAFSYSSQVHAACIQSTENQPGTRVECTRLVFEIGASLRLFGGRRALLAAIRTDLEKLDYRFTAGIGDSPQAALAFARAPRGKRQGGLEHLPIECLELAPRTAASLTASGLSFTGELLALPPAALARRYGKALLDDLERLRGRRPHGLTLHRLPERYRTRHELTGVVETTQGLKFVLRRVLAELAAFLRGADAAIQTLRLTLIHESHPPTRVTLRLATPSHDAAHLERVVDERLARLRLAAPVLEIELASDRLRRIEAHQDTLWQDQDNEHNSAWPAVLDRLRARLGHEAVGWLHALPDHQPDKASAIRDQPPQRHERVDAPRPLWLFDSPQPVTGDVLELLSDAERIETGWWQDGIRRDYFRARDAQGRLLWVYRELTRDGRDGDAYYLQGLFG